MGYEAYLIKGLRRGDIEAFDQLFELYRHKLFRFAMRYLKSETEAEDLIQEVFIKLWENRKNIKSVTSLKSYLFTISYNQIRMFFRRSRYAKEFLNSASLEKTDNSSERSIECKSTLNQIYSIVDLLPEKQRNIFLKSRKEGKSAIEIAREMSLSSGTVNNSISRSLKFISERLVEKI